MQITAILFNRRIMLLLTLITIMLITGCKISLKNEIWLNKDESGKALIQADIEVEKEAGEIDESQLSEYNVMQDYINKIEKHKGVKLISQNVIDNSNAETIAYSYQVEFKFDDIASLNSVLGIDANPTFQNSKDGNKKRFKVFPAKHSMIENSDLMSALFASDFVDVRFNMIVHTPTKVSKVNGTNYIKSDDKTVSWEVPIDESWQEEPIEEFVLWYE